MLKVALVVHLLGNATRKDPADWPGEKLPVDKTLMGDVEQIRCMKYQIRPEGEAILEDSTTARMEERMGGASRTRNG